MEPVPLHARCVDASGAHNDQYHGEGEGESVVDEVTVVPACAAQLAATPRRTQRTVLGASNVAVTVHGPLCLAFTVVDVSP